MKYSIFFRLILFIFFTINFNCKQKKHLDKITSTQPYFKNSENILDSIKSTNLINLKSNFLISDSLIGNYNFNAINGLQGHTLILKKKNNFTENLWSDNTFKEKTFKGKWFIKDSMLWLKVNQSKIYSFIIYKQSEMIFLVPKSK